MRTLISAVLVSLFAISAPAFASAPAKAAGAATVKVKSHARRGKTARVSAHKGESGRSASSKRSARPVK